MSPSKPGSHTQASGSPVPNSSSASLYPAPLHSSGVRCSSSRVGSPTRTTSLTNTSATARVTDPSTSSTSNVNFRTPAVNPSSLVGGACVAITLSSPRLTYRAEASMRRYASTVSGPVSSNARVRASHAPVTDVPRRSNSTDSASPSGKSNSESPVADPVGSYATRPRTMSDPSGSPTCRSASAIATPNTRSCSPMLDAYPTPGRCKPLRSSSGGSLTETTSTRNAAGADTAPCASVTAKEMPRVAVSGRLPPWR